MNPRQASNGNQCIQFSGKELQCQDLHPGCGPLTLASCHCILSGTLKVQVSVLLVNWLPGSIDGRDWILAQAEERILALGTLPPINCGVL